MEAFALTSVNQDGNYYLTSRGEMDFALNVETDCSRICPVAILPSTLLNKMKLSSRLVPVPTVSRIVFLSLSALCIAMPFGIYTGPPDGDPSAWTALVLGYEPHDGPDHMNEGAFDGGNTGTRDDAFEDNSVPDAGEGGGVFNMPTGGKPSPLFGASEFEQQLLRFEEFGAQPMPSTFPDPGVTLPIPVDAQSTPDGTALDYFLAQSVFPQPQAFSNQATTNPWKSLIETYLGQTLATAVGEGRPPGEGWSHQRYAELAPTSSFQTATTGARTNGGLRDSLQKHGYSQGEFAPGFLYHNPAGLPGKEGTTEGIDVRFHPDMPIQTPQTLWTFDGTLPPKLLMARIGNPIHFRHWNGLPIDIASNRGFGCHTLTTHEHNGHTGAESDGYTNAFFFPGQFYDYNWPMIIAGHDTLNTSALDSRAGYPDGVGGIVNVPGDYREVMSTHWFHDHMLDFTAQNVYKGSAAMMNYYSSMDRGNEVINDGVNMRFPSGSALDWGNRDYDVNLAMSCKAWFQDGQLWYNPFQTDGFLGDIVLTNWLYSPYMDVRARKYRFRLLNASVARYFKFALVVELPAGQGSLPGPADSLVSYDPVPFHMIANDGNIMAHAIPFDGTGGTSVGELPTMGIGERYDIIVDFSQYQPGDKIYMVNLMEHQTGRKPNRAVKLGNVLNGSYAPATVDDDADGVPDRWINGDPTVLPFLELRVQAMAPGQSDQSMNPADYEPGKKIMVPQPTFSAAELANARVREFKFGRSSGTDEMPWTIKTNDGAFNMDPRRITAAPNIGDVEIWKLETGGGWSHPVHIHFEEGKILSRDDEPPPIWERFGRKDIYRIGNEVDSSREISIALRFRDFNGTYMEHCHNTTHEDTAMLKRWDLEFPGQVKLMPSPLPSWDFVDYVDTFALPHFRVGEDGVGNGGGGGYGGGGSPPVALPDQAATTPPSAVFINVVANDLDPDGDLDPESVVIGIPPTMGAAIVVGGGWVRYTPNATATGTDTFQYSVSDLLGNTSLPALVSVSLGGSGGNTPPVAVPDQASTSAPNPVDIRVTDNDFDADGDLDVESVALVSQPTQGTASVTGGGWVRYVPNNGASGTDSFLYTVSDLAGNVSNQASVVVSIGGGGGGGGSPPQANADQAGTNVPNAVDVRVTDNDFDVDGDLDVESVVIDTQPSQGTATASGNGWVRYTPNSGASGTDSFIYTVSDLAGNVSNKATVTIALSGGGNGSPPQANPDQGATTASNWVDVRVTDNDSDPDGDLDIESVTLTSTPAQGTSVVLGGGWVRYSANASAAGSDSFGYLVSDFAGNVSNATSVTININGGGGGNGGNNPPSAIFDQAITPGDQFVDFSLTSNDVDPDGDLDPSSVVIMSSPMQGTVVLLGNGVVRFTPFVNLSSSDSFTYRVYDLAGNVSNSASVQVTINGTKGTPPVGLFDQAEVKVGGFVDVELAGNDYDIDGDLDVESIELTRQTLKGSVVILGGGWVRYTPSVAGRTSDSFTYVIYDLAGNMSSETTCSISIGKD